MKSIKNKTKKPIKGVATLNRSVRCSFMGEDLYVVISGRTNTIVVIRNGVQFRIVLPE